MPVSVEERRQLEQLVEYRGKVKDRIKRLQVLENGASTDFWKALKGELEACIKLHEAGRDMILESLDPGDPIKSFIRAKDAASEIKAYKGVIADVEQASDKVAAMNQKSAELKQRIDEIQNKHMVKHPKKGVINDA